MKGKEKNFDELLKEAEKLKNRIFKDWLKDPNVVGIGVGRRTVKGEIQDEVAIIFIVRKKMDSKELKEHGFRPIPKYIRSFRTDVVTHTVVRNEKREKRRALVAEAKLIKESLKEEWMGHDNVVAMGVGLKSVKGKLTHEIAIIFYVEDKYDEGTLKKKGIRIVPKEVQGIKTDVKKHVRMRARQRFDKLAGARTKIYNPLVGGIPISTYKSPFAYGTLGCLVYDRDTGRPMALTNAHVTGAESSFGEVGDEIIQPAPVPPEFTPFPRIGEYPGICGFFESIGIMDEDEGRVSDNARSVLWASGVVGCVAAALSDGPDITRRGQEATSTTDDELTMEERVRVAIGYPDFPLAGTPYKLNVKSDYVRMTNKGEHRHQIEETRQNEHVLSFKRLYLDKKKYRQGEKVHLLAVIMPEIDKGKHCNDYYAVAYLCPDGEEKTRAAVLRPINEFASQQKRSEFAGLLSQAIQSDEDLPIIQKSACAYGGEVTLDQNEILGPWHCFLVIQTADTTPPDTPPLEAATHIGGLVASKNVSRREGECRLTSDPDSDLEVEPWPQYE